MHIFIHADAENILSCELGAASTDHMAVRTLYAIAAVFLLHYCLYLRRVDEYCVGQFGRGRRQVVGAITTCFRSPRVCCCDLRLFLRTTTTATTAIAPPAAATDTIQIVWEELPSVAAESAALATIAASATRRCAGVAWGIDSAWEDDGGEEEALAGTGSAWDSVETSVVHMQPQTCVPGVTRHSASEGATHWPSAALKLGTPFMQASIAMSPRFGQLVPIGRLATSPLQIGPSTQ